MIVDGTTWSMRKHREIINKVSLVNRSMYRVVLERGYDSQSRIFALCENCYWTATILKKVGSYQCPLCHSNQVALIPLRKDEKYEYSLESRQGIQIKFSLLSKEISR